MASRVRPATRVLPGVRGAQRRAGELSAALALLSLVLASCPMPWLWLGLGGGIFAITAGFTTYRDGRLGGGVRLLAAAAAAVALLAVILAALRVALSIAATARLEQLLS
jgi:hypothetical protein